MHFPRIKAALAVVALLAAFQAGAAVPGSAGNIASSLSIAPSTVQFAGSGSSATITVTANVSWTVIVDAPWLNPFQASGNNNGSFTVTALANTTDVVRDGTITVTGGGIARSITVTQFPQLVTPTLTVSPAALALSGSAQSVQVTVNSNVAWQVSAGGFVSVSPSFGFGNGTFTLSVTANNLAPRVASISVTGGGLTRSISVTQTVPFGPAPFINVTPTSVALPAGVSVATLNVIANVPWTVSANQPWLSFTPVAGGNGNGTDVVSVTTVAMRAGANPNTAPRTAFVTFGSTFGISRVLVVTQAGQAPADGVATATAVTTSSGPWFTEEQVRLINTAPVTALTITITVQRTLGVNPGGQFNTVGGAISQGVSSTATAITHTFTLNAGQTLAPGIVRTFAAQSLGSGTAHPTSGDTFVATGIAGGQPFTLNGTF